MDGKPSDERLGSVFVFDSVTASHYLTSDGPTTFTPYGLDVLPKLSRICDYIAEKIKGEVSSLDSQIAAGKLSLEKHPNTVIGNAVALIDGKAQASKIMPLGNMSEADTKRLADLRTLLSSNPKKKAQETRAAKKRIEDFKIRLDEQALLLGAVQVEALKKCLENAVATATAAKSSVESRFGEGVLVGTGSDLWLALWEAAREFSNGAA